jgi:hypothetical protein
MKLALTLLVVLWASYSSLSFAVNSESMQETLERLAKDPVAFSKADRKQTELESTQLSLLRNEWRNKIKNSSSALSSSSIIEDNDLPAQLVDVLRFTSLTDMQNNSLDSARIGLQPWSDSYWPLLRGGIANRYADANYRNSTDWIVNYNYLTRVMGQGPVDELSPAEKYDLLIGDYNFTLTRAVLSLGQEIYQQFGKVEPWIGICHGWAAAAYMLPRPQSSVQVVAANGQVINFRPSDIKALTSLLWANGNLLTRFIGGRCEENRPATDSRGRAINPKCLDTNSGAWHLSVVNQIGVSGRSFVMDATASAEVWNQPVVGYRYNIFNPITMRIVSNVADASVPLSRFTGDRFRDVRAYNAYSVVGVVMDLTYSAETNPNRVGLDNPAFDNIKTVRYTYDLELDVQGNIVGGEWYNSEHPDFLWSVVAGNTATSVGDEYLSRSGDRSLWNRSQPLPQSWRQAALSSSPRSQPLARIVESLGRGNN